MAWAAGWLVIRSPGDRPIAGLSLAIQGLAVVEYGISVLADATETDRHLILFHLATDIAILLLPALLSKIYASSPQRIALGGLAPLID